MGYFKYLILFRQIYPPLVLAKNCHFFFCHDQMFTISWAIFDMTIVWRSRAGISLLRMDAWNTNKTETGKVNLLFYSRSFVLRQKASYGFAMKPFLCTICGKRRFATDYGRAEHQRALHGIRGIYFCTNEWINKGVWATSANRKRPFRILGQWFYPCLREIVSLRVKTLCNYYYKYCCVKADLGRKSIASGKSPSLKRKVAYQFA